jgi:hypothetical protein
MLHPFMHPLYLLCIHAIGAPEGVTLLEFEPVIPEESQEQQEPEEPAGDEAPSEGLPECPDHRPSTFLKGKPRCILNLLIYKLILSTFNCLLH